MPLLKLIPAFTTTLVLVRHESILTKAIQFNNTMLSSHDISRAFKMFDPSDCGYVSECDAGLLLQALVGELTSEELHATVRAMDVECNGKIMRQDFQRLVMRKAGEHSASEDVWRSFLCLTRSCDKLDMSVIRKFCSENSISRNELEFIDRHFACDVGCVTYEMWKRVVTSIS